MMNENNKSKKKSYSNDIRDLVVLRIEAQLPGDIKLFRGNGDSFTKAQIIDHVNARDAIGTSMVEDQMNFLKAVAKGTFAAAINTV